MNAIDLLKQDHRIVDGLFKQVEDTPPSRHPALFKRIKGELDAHAHVEEKIFYPVLKKRGKKDLVDMVLEGLEEHSQMKKFLREIAAIDVKNERFEPKLKVLIEDTRHHVKEEERMVTGMFALAEAQLGDETLEKLGLQMEAEKKKFQSARGFKPEKREPATSPIGAIVEKAKEVVTGIFTSKDGDALKPKQSSQPKASNGKAIKNVKATAGSKAQKTPSAAKKNVATGGPRP
jgi:hypothetical protein